MSGPLVSIITISYNSERHIEQTIRSVIDQDYPNIEYLVVDGGSTDGTVDIIKRYEDKIAKWVSEPDRGPNEAIKKGLKMATGDMIALLNSDDYYADNTVVRRVVEVFGSSPDVKMVYGILNYIDNISGKSIMKWGRDREPSEIRKRMYLPTPTLFSRREVWDEVGPYRDDYDYADDYEWTLRAVKTTRPYFLNYVTACMRDKGRSDRNYRAGLAEVARALRENGHYADYVITLIRNFVKIVLTELGLKNLILKVWKRNVISRGS
jgi:glycosyltransferase involved in cell wall biosynthesis